MKIKAWRVTIRRYWESTVFEFENLNGAESFIQIYTGAYVPAEGEAAERDNETDFMISPVFEE